MKANRLMTAIHKLNKSGLTDEKKSEYFSSFVRKLGVRPTKADVMALQYDTVQFLVDMRRYRLIKTLTEEDVLRKISVNLSNVRQVNRLYRLSNRHVWRIFGIVASRAFALLDRKLTFKEVCDNLTYECHIVEFFDLFKRPPTLAQIKHFFSLRRMSPENMFRTLARFGYPIDVRDILQVFVPFGYWGFMRDTIQKEIVHAVHAHSVPIDSAVLVQYSFCVYHLGRHLLHAACPVLFRETLVGRPNYHEEDVAYFHSLKSKIRVVQRFLRSLHRNRKAAVIQRAWRRALADPYHPVGRKRLLSEYNSLVHP